MRDTLLNRQAGGTRVSYKQSLEDELMFYRCRTNFMSKLLVQPLYAERMVHPEMKALFSKIRNWSVDSGGPDASKRITMLESLIESKAAEATPQLINGRPVFTFIGERATRYSLQYGARSFIDGLSYTSSFTRYMLTQLMLLESSLGQVHRTWTTLKQHFASRSYTTGRPCRMLISSLQR